MASPDRNGAAGVVGRKRNAASSERGLAAIEMDQFWPIVNSAAIFALGLLVTFALRRANTAVADKKALIEWQSRVDQQMAVLLTQVSPLWAAVQSKIAKDLTHPSAQFQEMDELLRQLEALTITDDGRTRLHDLLRERSTTQDPEVNDEERASAKLMIGIMEKVVAEAADPTPVEDLKVVGAKPGKEEVEA